MRIIVIIVIAVVSAICVYAYSIPHVLSYQAPPEKVLTPKEMVEFAFKDDPVMIKIARAESRFDPLAKNPKSTAKGIFQILDGTWKYHKCTGDVLKAEDNIQCAKKIYEKNGTRDWDASKSVWSVVK